MIPKAGAMSVRNAHFFCFSSIFVGWFMSQQLSRDELGFRSEGIFRLWHNLLRFVVPPAVFIIFIMGVGE